MGRDKPESVQFHGIVLSLTQKDFILLSLQLTPMLKAESGSDTCHSPEIKPIMKVSKGSINVFNRRQ